MLRLSLLMLLLLVGFARAQDSDRRDLGESLGPNTVQELSARLMQMQGKLDPTTLGKLLAELKKNPGMSKEELFKLAGQQSGLPQNLLEQFMPMMNDPKFLEQIKGMAGEKGKSLGNGAGFSKEQLEDLTKKLNASAPKITAPKIDLTGQGNVNLPKVDFPNMGKMNSPNFTPPNFNFPKGSMPNISPTAQKVMGFWENNIGPLNQSPAVHDAIQKMFASSMSADGTPTNFFGFMEKSGYDGNGFANWLNSSSGGSSWHLPSWLGGGSSGGSSSGSSWNWGGGNSGTSGTGAAGTGGLAAGGSWWSVVLFVIVAGGGLVLWWLWPRLMQGGEKAAANPALVRPDIDPNGVIDRETLIKVFEALSIQLCGDDAKVWTHSTLGAALREFLASNPSAADRLALIYALARYTPVEEPLGSGNLQEARTHLGQLAGVPAG